MGHDSPKFIAGRAARHEAVKRESLLAQDLMKEFVKLRDGDVSAKELDDLFHAWGMPSSRDGYTKARESLGLPLRKTISRHPSRTRRAEMAEQFRELIETTPDNKRPRHVPPKNGTPEPVKPRPPVQAIFTPDTAVQAAVKDMDTELLIAAHDELVRRIRTSRALLARIKARKDSKIED